MLFIFCFGFLDNRDAATFVIRCLTPLYEILVTRESVVVTRKLYPVVNF